MAIGPYSPTWEEALKDFLLHIKATKAPKTLRFYDVQLRQLIRWTGRESVDFTSFGKRHLDRYLAERAESVSRNTLRHDAIAAKSFFKWCAKNDLLLRNPLAEYEVHNAPRPAMYMPTLEDMQALLTALGDYWNPEKNPGMKNIPRARRLVHRERNYALLLLLLDSACRIGEVLNLKLEDYRPKAFEITVRESKGKEPRTVPISAGTVEAISSWLKTRERLMSGAAPEEDEGWLFLSEYGTQMDSGRFLKAIKAVLRFAGLSENITLHSLRRHSINKLSKINVLGAQHIAGHKDTKTTLLYTKLDPGHLRETHDQAGVVDAVLSNRRVAKRKRLT
jgi:Site-specific recombinase XerD